MTKDEYVHYSDCRQASFTYRKGEHLPTLNSLVEHRLTRLARRFREFINFAAYLDVRPNDDIIDILGFLAFEMVRSLCVTALDVRTRHETPPIRAAPTTTATTITASPVKRKSIVGESPNKRRRSEHPASTSPEADAGVSRKAQTGPRVPVPLFAAPPSARQPLTTAHVLEAYAQIQRQQAASRVGGMRNFRGAITKGRMALV